MRKLLSLIIVVITALISYYPISYSTSSPSIKGRYIDGIKYINQINDTQFPCYDKINNKIEENFVDFNGGWACGATTSVMIVNYFNRLPKETSRGETERGAFVCQDYTFNEYDFKDKYTKSKKEGIYGGGAYGFIHNPTDQEARIANAEKFYELHGLETPGDITDFNFNLYKQYIDNGFLVYIRTYIQTPGLAGHIVLGKGYLEVYEKKYIIVNDPYYNGTKKYDFIQDPKEFYSSFSGNWINLNGDGLPYQWNGKHETNYSLEGPCKQIRQYWLPTRYASNKPKFVDIPISSPTLIYPVNNTEVSRPVKLSWLTVPNATKYAVEVKESKNNKTIINEKIVNAPSSSYVITEKLTSGKEYVWKVKAGNNSFWSEQSDGFKFFVKKNLNSKLINYYLTVKDASSGDPIVRANVTTTDGENYTTENYTDPQGKVQIIGNNSGYDWEFTITKTGYKTYTMLQKVENDEKKSIVMQKEGGGDEYSSFLSITNPSSGEPIKCNTKYTIKWTANNLTNNVYLWYKKSTDIDKTYIVTKNKSETSFDWTTPSTAGEYELTVGSGKDKNNLDVQATVTFKVTCTSGGEDPGKKLVQYTLTVKDSTNNKLISRAKVTVKDGIGLKIVNYTDVQGKVLITGNPSGSSWEFLIEKDGYKNLEWKENVTKDNISKIVKLEKDTNGGGEEKPLFLSITNPSSGEPIKCNTIYTIKWTANNLTNNVYLWYKKSTDTGYIYINSINKNTTFYDWITPSTVGLYELFISSGKDKNTFDVQSSVTFNITCSNGGEDPGKNLVNFYLTVKDASNGNPIVRAKVVVTDGNNHTMTNYTDTEGIAQIIGNKSGQDWEFEITKSGYKTHTMSLNVIKDSKETITLQKEDGGGNDGKKPDLVAPSFDYSGPTVTEGDSYYVHPVVKNIGEGKAGRSYVTVMLSPGEDWNSSDDLYLASGYVDPLNPGSEIKVNLPANTFPRVGSPSGNSYKVWIIIVVDSNKEVDESNEDNVFKSKDPITVTKKSSGPGDDPCRGVPNAPILISPCGGQVYSPVTLEWNAVKCATYYGVYVRRLSDKKLVVDNDSVYGTKYTVSLEPGDYKWNARAGNDYGWSGFSDDCYFTVISSGGDNKASITITYPYTGLNLKAGDSITIKWTSQNVKESIYVYYVDSNDKVYLISGPLSYYSTSCPWSIPTSLSGNYQVCVASVKADNTVEAGECVNVFIQSGGGGSGGCGTPTMIAPADGTTFYSAPYDFSWTSVSGADYYHINFYDASYNDLGGNADFTATSVRYGELSTNTKYWRVRAHCPNGWSEWSPYRSITISRNTMLIEMLFFKQKSSLAINFGKFRFMNDLLFMKLNKEYPVRRIS